MSLKPDMTQEVELNRSDSTWEASQVFCTNKNSVKGARDIVPVFFCKNT